MVKIEEKLLTPNKYSRPKTELGKVKGIVIHYVANPKSSASANRNFFENRKRGKTDYGSAHYIIGLDGEIIRCIPDDEVAYHVGSKTYTSDALNRLSSYPNNCTLGIECTHVDKSGRMTIDTYNSLLQLCAVKLKEFGLTSDDLWLHKEVVGWKDCHKWFVDDPEEWQEFKKIVGEVMASEAEQKVSPWAKDAQEWVKENKISDGEHPKDPVTREQLWTMLYRASK